MTASSMRSFADFRPITSTSILSTVCKEVVKIQDLGVLDWSEKARSMGVGGVWILVSRHLRCVRENPGRLRLVVLPDPIQLRERVRSGWHRGLEYAAAKGLGVIVMEPLFGGTLANPPQPIWEMWNNNHHKHRPADVALRWLWNKPEVSLVLSA